MHSNIYLTSATRLGIMPGNEDTVMTKVDMIIPFINLNNKIHRGEVGRQRDNSTPFLSASASPIISSHYNGLIVTSIVFH